MDVMILYKWTHPIDNAPNIINSLICMAMGQQDNNPLWDGSVQMAQTLMKFTVLSVLIMLFPHKAQQKNKGEGPQLLRDEEEGVLEAAH